MAGALQEISVCCGWDSRWVVRRASLKRWFLQGDAQKLEEAVLARREKGLSRQRDQQGRVPEVENGLAGVRNSRRPEAGDG